MAYVFRDYECQNPKCKQPIWEEMVERSEENNQKCPKCGIVARYIISPTHLATYSMMSKDDQAKHLRKRSRDHTRKELKKDPTQARMTKRLKMKGSR